MTKSTQDQVATTIDNASGTIDPIPPRIYLKTIDEVRLEMAKVYREMRTGKVEPGTGTKLAYVLGTIAKMIEMHDLEKRIEKLENLRDDDD